MDRYAQRPVGSERTSANPYDLFIVHAVADRAWVEGYLKVELGLEPGRAITPREFSPTATLPAEFERAVTSSRFTLLVLSQAFLADEWARFGEHLVAFASVEASQNRLLAVDRQACDLPLSLRFRVRLNLTDADQAGWENEIARLRAVLDRPAPMIEAVKCPYPGMVPFRKEDARFFHGRDEEIQTLVTLVRQHRFLLVIGPSGSGKSSLVTAGLLPKLDDPKHFPSSTWRVLTMRPGSTPLDELARVLGGALDDATVAVTALLDGEPSARRFLLVIDQFEELFSQVKDVATREAFIERLKSLRADPNCLVILTMRADFYGDLMTSPFWPVDKSQIVNIAPLHGDALRKAIVKPAEAVGVFLEEGLIEHLIGDAANEPGSLPLLQEALVLLWGTMSSRLLTRASYESLGRDGRSGLAVAMATKADATLANLPLKEQRIARRIFLRLVQFGEGRPDTRRQLGVDDLRAATDAPDAFDEVLQLLISNRLLTPSADESRGRRLDIAHEMLIVGWPASQEWVRVRRAAETTRRRLVTKAEEWVRMGRGENGLLDLAELTEAGLWLASPDAAELGIDPDVQSLAKKSRGAIEYQQRRKQMWTRVAIGGLSAAVLVISMVAIWGDLKRQEAQIAKFGAEQSSKLASESQKRAEENARKANANAAELLMVVGSTALVSGQSFDAMHRFAEAIKILPNSANAQDVMRQGLGFLARETPRLQTIVTHPDRVMSAAFSKDGSRVVTASWAGTARIWQTDTGAELAKVEGQTGRVYFAAFSEDGSRVVTISSDGAARIWQTDTGAPIVTVKGHTDWVNSAAFDYDGRRIVTASNDKTARIWQTDTGNSVELKGHTGVVNSAEFSKDGSRVVTASNDRTARIWQTDTGNSVELKGHTDRVNSAAFHWNGSRVVTASNDHTARIWQTDTGKSVELKGHMGSVTSAAFDKLGLYVVTASTDKTARIWQTNTGASMAELKGHTGWVNSAAFSNDGSRVVTTSNDDTARIWQTGTGVLITELKGHANVVTSAAFSEDGLRVVTASNDKTARIWRTDANAMIAELNGHADAVTSAAFSSDGLHVVTASRDNAARIFPAGGGNSTAVLKGHTGVVTSAAFSNDGSRVVTASEDKTARIFPVDGGASIAELKGHTGVVTSAAFNNDGSRVVTASEDKTARIFPADGGASIAELKGHTDVVTSAQFSKDGRFVITASRDNTARIFPAGGGASIAELRGHKDVVRSAMFSEDGRLVITASNDNSARIWRSAEQAMIAELKGHTDWVNSAAFSADGRFVITASNDKTARIWRSDTGAVTAVLKGHANAVNSAAFSKDGRRVVTASWDGTARIWNVEVVPGDPSVMPLWVEVLTGTEFKDGAVRSLSLEEWNQRKDDLRAKGKDGSPADWFTRVIVKTPKS